MDKRTPKQIVLSKMAEKMAYDCNITVFERQNGTITHTYNREKKRTDGVNPDVEYDADTSSLLIHKMTMQQLLPLEGGLSIWGISFDKATGSAPLTIHITSPKDMKHVSDLMYAGFAPDPVRKKPDQGHVRKKILDTYKLGTHTTELLPKPVTDAPVQGYSDSKHALTLGKQYNLHIHYLECGRPQLNITCPDNDCARRVSAALTMRAVSNKVFHGKNLEIMLETPDAWHQIEKALAHVRSKQEKSSGKSAR